MKRGCFPDLYCNLGLLGLSESICFRIVSFLRSTLVLGWVGGELRNSPGSVLRKTGR